MTYNVIMLGLKRGTVKLVPYDPEWKENFKDEAVKLKSVFSNYALTVEHIGSTAIPAVLAKPTLDIGVIVPSLEETKNFEKELKEIGYTLKENDREERLFFTKGPEELRTNYLHIGEKGSNYIEDMIRFRDYLNSHAETAKEYSDLKEKLLDVYDENREQYTEQKTKLVQDVLTKA